MITSPLVARPALAQAQKPPRPPVRFDWDDHPSLRFGDQLRIDFRARFTTDIRDFDPDTEIDETGLDLARRRVGVEGTFLRHFEYEVERELRRNDAWRDVFLNFRYFRPVQVRAGKFKMPFSRDELTGATNLDFMHRSRIADLLAPGRDIGVMVHGQVVDRRVEYQVGVFEHDGRNAQFGDRARGDQTRAARLILQPLRGAGAFDTLEFGGAFTTSEVSAGRTGLRGRNVAGQTYFSNFYVNGTRTRQGAELVWTPGPASVKAEWIRVWDQRIDQAEYGGTLPDLEARGWYVSGTYALTGEKKADGLDRPRKPLPGGGFGAVELAARYERLYFGIRGTSPEPAFAAPRAENITPNSDYALTAGLNWYVNRWVKLQFNLVREEIDDCDCGPEVGARTRLWSRLFRIQFVL